MNAPQGNRFGSFFNRVQTEREVLDLVNRRFGPQTQLSGLSEATIKRWSDQILENTEIHKTEAESIVDLLHRIAVRADANADQSRVVFDNNPRNVLPINELVVELRSRCQL